MANVTEIVLTDIVNELEACLLTIREDPERMDGVVIRLESILSAFDLLNDGQEFEWKVNFVDSVTHAVTILKYQGDTCHIGSASNRFAISRETLETMISLNFSVPKISNMIGVPVRTVQRRMEDFGLKIADTYTKLTDEELELEVLAILRQQPNTGYKRMKGHLAVRGIKVTERRLINTMRTADPLGVYQRTIQRNRTIRRRQYYVKYSNEIWHIDANLKLNRWGFVIRAGIDGKSRAATYVTVSSDNRSDTHLTSFLEGVGKWGLPLRTRTDKGKENIGIARCMLENRGTGRSSHICGRSVHNQRVERFWRDLSEGCMAFYYNLFWALEEDGHLQIDNPKMMYLLHYIFIPRLNSSAEEFAFGWNLHPLTTEHNMTPMQIMASNLFPAEYDTSLSDLVDDGDLVISDMDDLNRMEENITNPLEVMNVLSQQENVRLNSFTYPNNNSIMDGYDMFINALHVVLLH